MKLPRLPITKTDLGAIAFIGLVALVVFLACSAMMRGDSPQPPRAAETTETRGGGE